MNPAVHQCHRNAVGLRNRSPRRPIRCAANESPVQALRFIGRPAAVVRAIAQVVVSSVNRQIRRVPAGLSPITKNGEAAPFRADRNSAPAVLLVSGRLWVIAAIAHRFPNPMQPRAASAVRQSVLPSGEALEAAARSGLATAKVRPQRRPRDSAIANGGPQGRAARRVACLRDDGPEAKALASKVNESRVLCHARVYLDNHGSKVSGSRR